MIVWGGGALTNTGGRYDPVTDSWVATSTTNAPSPRSGHRAVWTDSEMIVWGGVSGPDAFLNTGGRYDPVTDSWVATSTTNTPSARRSHTVVWTGREMIVWGGANGPGAYLNTGGRYDPVTDRWVATSTTSAPSPRYYHTAVWTGREMIVWGGDDYPRLLNTGGRYDPATDSWATTSVANAPSARYEHTAVWTGREMIVWGGQWPDTNAGGRYDPATDSWVPTSGGAPSARQRHTAVWTGSEMIVWGGAAFASTGGRYDPTTESWGAISAINAPSGRSWHTAVWTGTEMIVWGGRSGHSPPIYFNTGGRYDPATDSWVATSPAAAAGRVGHTAVWTGSEMIIWGGWYRVFRGSVIYLNSGGRYDPDTNRWRTTRVTDAPSPRSDHTAVWTGDEMIVWGGVSNPPPRAYNTGGRYDPKTDSWIATSTTDAPSPLAYHTAVWTDSEMIVWGGDTGGRYDPKTDSWVATSTTDAPIPRWEHTAVWTGSEMIIWGGRVLQDPFLPTNTGGRYNPEADNWIATSTTDAPAPRTYHTAVWTGSEMIIWGGSTGRELLDTGGRYCAAAPGPP